MRGYQPPTLIGSPEDTPETQRLRQLIQQELEQIAVKLQAPDFHIYKKLTAAPTKPREGMVVYADGTDWNPGSGEGFYGYYAASWKKLG